MHDATGRRGLSDWRQPGPRPPVPAGPYLVAGVGSAGTSAARALTDLVPNDQLWLHDDAPSLSAFEALGLRRLELQDGAMPDSAVPSPVTLVKSPGIPADAPVLAAGRAAGLAVIDEAELGWRLEPRPQFGVTGTNGKSTTAMLMAEVLGANGVEPIIAGNTTFGPPLTGSRGEAGDVVVAELSSFQLENCTELLPEAAVFTNLTLDHLYRHGSLERYAACKRSLFLRSGRAVPFAAVGIDQEFGRALADDLEAAGSRVVRFGAHENSDRRVLAAAEGLSGGMITVTEGANARGIATGLAGWHNALNVAGALAFSDALGLDPESSAWGISQAGPLPGRFERVDGPGDFDVIVDFAHNPDGAAKALDAARAVLDSRGGGSLSVVLSSLTFVDAAQGSAFARAARERADRLILTTQRWKLDDASDQLGPGLLAGAESSAHGALAIEPDRREAIRQAINGAESGDIVMVLERGSRSGLLYNSRGEAEPFDDREVVRQLLAQRSEA